MPEPINVALVGAGAFAAEHARGYDSISDVAISCVIDTDAARARELARSLGGVPWHTDLDQALETERLQAVDICTPNASHYGLAKRCLTAGKHILVEKPPALSLQEFDDLATTALAHGVTVTTGLVMRHFPLARGLRRVVDAAAIGRPRHLSLSLRAGMTWPGAWRAWQRDDAVSGGHILHNGCHLFDLADWLIGEQPVRVYTRGYRVHAPYSGTDDHWTATVAFTGGSTATCAYSYTLPDPKAVQLEAFLLGDAGSVRYNSADGPRVMTGAGSSVLEDFRGDSMHRQLAEFATTVRSGQAAGAPWSAVRQALQLAVGADLSRREHRVVQLAELT
jgi:predicted dehydrogenase